MVSNSTEKSPTGFMTGNLAVIFYKTKNVFYFNMKYINT